VCGGCGAEVAREAQRERGSYACLARSLVASAAYCVPWRLCTNGERRQRNEGEMAKRSAAHITESEYGELAEVALGVYWARSLFHAALDVIAQTYLHLDAIEQERLARCVAAAARARMRQG
jgi:hypothetical protein